MKGETKSGFKFVINDNIKKDFRFWRKLSKLANDPFKAFELYEELLGSEQLDKLEKHVENKQGIAPIDKIEKEISEIFAILGQDSDTKNS